MPTSASVSHTLSDISVPMLTLPDGQGSDYLTATQPLSFDRSFTRSKVEIGELFNIGGWKHCFDHRKILMHLGRKTQQTIATLFPSEGPNSEW